MKSCARATNTTTTVRRDLHRQLMFVFVLLLGIFAILFGPAVLGWFEARTRRARYLYERERKMADDLGRALATARGQLLSAALLLKDTGSLTERETDVLYEQVLNAYVTVGGTEADYSAAQHHLRETVARAGRAASSS